MDHFEELASWDVGSLNTYLWDLLYLASCIPAILQWRRSYKYLMVFCGLGYRRFWLAKGADMVDLVIDIACIYGNGSRLISWNLSNLSPFFSGFQANYSRLFTYDMLKAASNLLFWWLRWMPEWMSVYHCKVTPFFFNWGLEENKDAACEFYLQNGFVLILKEAVLCKLKSWSILIWWFMLIQTLRGWAWITDFARSPTPYKT